MASQGDGKSVKEYVRGVNIVKDKQTKGGDGEDFLEAFNKGFKELD